MSDRKQKLHAIVDTMPNSLAERLLEFLDEAMSMGPEKWEKDAVQAGREAYRKGETERLEDVDPTRA